MLEQLISLISKYTIILSFLNIIPFKWNPENKLLIYQPNKFRVFIWYFIMFFTFFHGSVLIFRSFVFILTSSATVGIVRKIYTLYFTAAFGIGLCFCFTMISYKKEILALVNSAMSMTKRNNELSLMGVSSSDENTVNLLVKLGEFFVQNCIVLTFFQPPILSLMIFQLPHKVRYATSIFFNCPNQEPAINILPFYLYDTWIWIIIFANFFYGGCIHVLHVISTVYKLKLSTNYQNIVLFCPINYPIQAISIFQQMKIQTILWNECFAKSNMIPVLTIVYFHIALTAYATIRLYNSKEFISFVYYLPFPFLLICGLGPQYFLSTLFGTVHTCFSEFINSWKRTRIRKALFRKKIKCIFPIGIKFGNMFVFKKATAVSVVSISIELIVTLLLATK